MEDPRISRSKAKIRSALVELLQDRDFGDVTVRDVAAGSGVGFSTFYRHYMTKEDLLSEIASYEVRELVDGSFPGLVSGSDFNPSLVAAKHIDGRRPLWKALTSGTAGALLRDEFVTAMLSRSEGLSMGSDHLPRDVAASLSAILMVELLAWWLRQDEHGSPEYLANALDRTIVRPSMDVW